MFLLLKVIFGFVQQIMKRLIILTADSFVVNIGDMMEVFSNGKFKAPVHRVLANNVIDRFSLPYFLFPSYSFVVGPLKDTYDDQNPPKFRSFPWAEFRKGRYEGDYADKGEEIQINRYRI